MTQTIFYITLVFWIAISGKPKTETYHQKGKTLMITNQDPEFNPKVKKDLVKTFFAVYPQLVTDFNPKAIDTVHIRIDTSYTGVAYTSGDKIVINAAWLHKKPQDTDLLTHEVMHIIQSYPPHSGPGWLTEGIADYVRYKYGINNEGSGWTLTKYSDKQSYKNSYRITARFLVWITQNYDKDLVKKLDKNLRNNTYSNQLWKDYTSKTLDELWQAYSQKPALS